MATVLQAVRVYGPRLDLNKTAQITQISEFISSRTGLNRSEIYMVLQELNETMIFFGRNGTPIKLPEVGTFTPSINRNGVFSLGFRADMSLKNALNAPGAYQGRMINKENIGQTNLHFKALWDIDHPNDLLVLP